MAIRQPTYMISPSPSPTIASYGDHYENAFPILRDLGLTTTVATDFVDQEHAAYMTWPMLEEMATPPHPPRHPLGDLINPGGTIEGKPINETLP